MVSADRPSPPSLSSLPSPPQPAPPHPFSPSAPDTHTTCSAIPRPALVIAEKWAPSFVDRGAGGQLSLLAKLSIGVAKRNSWAQSGFSRGNLMGEAKFNFDRRRGGGGVGF
ncbi:hypothetical protein GMDG_04805 [Pseudogymnoascus destructans 20631-21]|uniref:Uncharacterized protein n=1 Tax=Pseudogymnoascus destructans (strain ATCC MYA-4855 / 20631-21) TaxID=658429 RepID=L8GBE3_PSED2|nr:hypothetical protein GMDG_04805 [Pseudogymnoascus destructans 20631-21]